MEPLSRRNQNTFVGLFIAALFAGSNCSSATLIAKDSFDYPTDSPLAGKKGPVGFASPYTAAGTGLQISAGSLTYGDLKVGGSKLSFSGTTNRGDVGYLTESPEVPGSSVYFSYLMQVDPGQGYAGVSLYQGNDETLFTGRRDGGKNLFGIDPRAGRPMDSTTHCTRTSLVVYRIDFATDSALVRLYVNPKSAVEPEEADVTILRTAPLSYDRVLFHSNGVSGSMDEFRLGTTFADVAPVHHGSIPAEVVVLGSSVAFGAGADPLEDGWSRRLETLLETSPPLDPDSHVAWKVHNASVGGDNTTRVLNRFEKDVAKPCDGADIVIIGLSLANEGLIGTPDPQSIFNRFENGLKEIISRCRKQGFYPVVALCYPQNNYNAEQYAYVRRMNLLINSWDVPSINLLGAIDNGEGHWVEGHFADAGHPNSQGHMEMFSSVVPSLFDSIIAGNTATPRWTGTDGFLEMERDESVSAPITYTPAQAYRSFTLSLRVLTEDTGTIATIPTTNSAVTLEIRDGSLAYISPSGEETLIPATLDNDNWHDIAISHRKPTDETLIFLDGQLKSTVNGELNAESFIIGGPGSIDRRSPAPQKAGYQDVAIYRAAWTEDEALAQSRGALQQASLDVLATLDDASPKKGSPLVNRAQSQSEIKLNTAKISAGIVR